MQTLFYSKKYKVQLMLNPIQAGVWNHTGSGGGALFLLYLWPNYNQTWHDSTLGQNLSKTIKMLLTSSLAGNYDVIKLFLISFQVKIRVPLIFCPIELKFGTRVNFEALISSPKIRYKYVLKNKSAISYKKMKFYSSAPWQKCCHGKHPRLLLTENYFKWCPI